MHTVAVHYEHIKEANTGDKHISHKRGMITNTKRIDKINEIVSARLCAVRMV